MSAAAVPSGPLGPSGPAAAKVRADRILDGTVLIVAPHMDDELIGCGATLASLAGKASVHVVYATDGAGSPAHPLPWMNVDGEALAAARRAEALEALRILGIPRSHAHFLGLPDGRLGRAGRELTEALADTIEELTPDHLLVPFRFDRHPDHIAVNRAARRLHGSRPVPGSFLEYFVYTQWRLLRGGDVRAFIAPAALVEAENREVSRTLKRRALEACRSQTTRFYDWQRRPNLTPTFLDAACAEPERFLRADPGASDTSVFEKGRVWIRVAHVVEPRLKRGKDRLAALIGRGG